MAIKRIRVSLILITFVLCLIPIAVVFVVRLPSYTIQTTGKLYVVNKVSRTVQVIDLKDGKEIAVIPIGIESHEAVTTQLQNKVLLTDYGASGSRSNILTVLDTKTNTIEKTIALRESIAVNGLLPLPEPNKVALVDYVNNAILILNLQTGNIEKQWSTQQQGSNLAVRHPEQALMYVTNNLSNSVSIIDIDSDELVKVVPCGSSPRSLAITPDGLEIWVTNKGDGTLTVIDALTYKVVDVLRAGVEPVRITFSVDGRYALVVNATEGNLYVYDRPSRSKIKTVVLHGKTTVLERALYHTPYPVNILMHPNGRYAFVANSNANKVEVLDMNSFEIISTLGTGAIPDALVFVE